jgi:hypothetical protein
MFHFLFLAAYLILLGVFLEIMHLTGRSFSDSVPPFDFLLLSLATFRVTEAITCDRITRFLRDPFILRRKVRRPDGESEEKVEPAGKGLRRTVGELLICPWCTGIWVGAFLVYLYLLFPSVARVVLLAFGAAGAGIIFELFAKLLDQKSEPGE